MSEEYRQVQHRHDLVRAARQRASALGADCEVAWSVAALAADVEITTLNESDCTGMVALR